MDIPDDFPKTELEFEARFATEEACLDYLRQVRWPGGFVCPGCDRQACWQLRSRALIECACCGRQTSVTSGTVFHGTRKPLRMWFRAMFLMTAQTSGLSARNFQRLMGLRNYGTAWTWLHKLRASMVRKDRPKLTGRVEVDETFVGGAVEGVPGRANPNPLVVAAVERRDTGTPRPAETSSATDSPRPRRAGLGRIRLSVVEDSTRLSLFTFIEENVERGSEVLTDGLASYSDEDLAAANYTHRKSVIGKEVKLAPVHLPGVHRVFSLLKRFLLGTYQGAVSRRHLPAYLEEFSFRFNRRFSATPVKPFHRLLEQAAVTKAVTYRELVKRAQPPPLPPPALPRAA